MQSISRRHLPEWRRFSVQSCIWLILHKLLEEILFSRGNIYGNPASYESKGTAAAQLAALDDASLQAALYNEFENRLSRLGELPVASREEIGSVYGGWEAME